MLKVLAFFTASLFGFSAQTQQSFTIESVATAGKWDAVQLTRVNRAAGDAAVDLWLRVSDGAPVRMRVGMNEKYGVLLDFKSTQLPATIAKY